MNVNHNPVHRTEDEMSAKEELAAVVRYATWNPDEYVTRAERENACDIIARAVMVAIDPFIAEFDEMRLALSEESREFNLAKWNELRAELGELDATNRSLARQLGESAAEVELLQAELSSGAWRGYSIETYGEAPYDTCVLCRSDGDCEWTRPNADGRYLTLGEAVDASRAHVEWHAMEDAEEVEIRG